MVGGVGVGVEAVHTKGLWCVAEKRGREDRMNHNLRHCGWPIPRKGGERTTLLHRRWAGGKRESWGPKGKRSRVLCRFVLGKSCVFLGSAASKEVSPSVVVYYVVRLLLWPQVFVHIGSARMRKEDGN